MTEKDQGAGQGLTEPSARVEQLLEQTCRQIVEGLRATSCSLSQWDRQLNVVTTQITYSRRPDMERPLHIEAGETYSLEDYPATARVLQQREIVSIRVDDPRADPAECSLLHDSGQQSLLMLPLVAHDEVIGLLEVFQRDRPRIFTPEDITLAQGLAEQAALSIEGSQIFAAARRETQDVAALLAASSAILSSLDLDHVLREVAGHLVRTARAEGCALSRYDAEQESVSTWIEYTAERVSLWHLDQPGTTYQLKDYPLTAKVLRERIPATVQVDDPQADPAERALLEKQGVRSLLMLPIVAYDRATGLVELMSRAYRLEFSERVITLAQMLTNQAAIAIENARLYSQVQDQLQDLRRASEAQTRLLMLMQEMSTPAIPVHDRVLVLPLIGVVDSGRAHQFTERLLEAVRWQRARVVIIDITGVPVVDTVVAQALIKAAEAARLLGAEVVLVGVRAEVAQTLVTLGLDMAGLVTKANLQSGIEHALGRLGLCIGPIPPPKNQPQRPGRELPGSPRISQGGHP
jgi:anti-anti-sigma factor